MRVRILILAVALAGPCAAEVRPVADKADPRLASVKANPGEPIHLELPVGRGVTLLLPPGEPLASANVSAPADWVVDAQGSGETVVVRPVRPVPDATLTLRTSKRNYDFTLSAAPSDSAPLVVRLSDSDTEGRRAGRPHRTDSAAQMDSRWKLSGARELRPSVIRDDGSKTFIEWAPDRPIPAVFAADRRGHEEMVNGYMRGSFFTIDRVHEQLIFRIDRAEARASRRSKGGGR